MAWPRREVLRRRFIAGEQIEDAIAAARALQAQGLAADARLPRRKRHHHRSGNGSRRASTCALIDDIVASGIERNISVKLSQLGLAIDRATCVDNMRRILEPAGRHEFFVRIDMEHSEYTEVTLEVFETLWNLDYRNIGVVLQSYLFRTERDLRRMNELGARVRLVKGAYREPAAVAYQQKADVDAAYLRQMRLLLDHGTYPAFATHDVALLHEIKAYAAERGITPRPVRVPDAVRHPP